MGAPDRAYCPEALSRGKSNQRPQAPCCCRWNKLDSQLEPKVQLPRYCDSRRMTRSTVRMLIHNFARASDAPVKLLDTTFLSSKLISNLSQVLPAVACAALHGRTLDANQIAHVPASSVRKNAPWQMGMFSPAFHLSVSDLQGQLRQSIARIEPRPSHPTSRRGSFPEGAVALPCRLAACSNMPVQALIEIPAMGRG